MEPYTDLPEVTRAFILQKQRSAEWQNNLYRTHGKLKKDAFKLAFENTMPLLFEETLIEIQPAITVADIQKDLARHAQKRWLIDPYDHYDIHSSVFTIAELTHYYNLRVGKTHGE